MQTPSLMQPLVSHHFASAPQMMDQIWSKIFFLFWLPCDFQLRDPDTGVANLPIAPEMDLRKEYDGTEAPPPSSDTFTPIRLSQGPDGPDHALPIEKTPNSSADWYTSGLFRNINPELS